MDSSYYKKSSYDEITFTMKLKSGLISKLKFNAKKANLDIDSYVKELLLYQLEDGRDIVIVGLASSINLIKSDIYEIKSDIKDIMVELEMIDEASLSDNEFEVNDDME